MPHMASIAPFFIVRDMGETISFYKEVLGFEVAFAAPEAMPLFAILRRDTVQIFFKSISAEVGPLPNSERHPWARWDAFVYSPDPDALALELSSHVDLQVAASDTEDGLRGFEVQDPNGYVLFCGRPIETA